MGTPRGAVRGACEKIEGLTRFFRLRTLSTGATELSLDIPLAHLGNTRVEDLFLDVKLLGLNVIGVAGRVTKEVS